MIPYFERKNVAPIRSYGNCQSLSLELQIFKKIIVHAWANKPEGRGSLHRESMHSQSLISIFQPKYLNITFPSIFEGQVSKDTSFSRGKLCPFSFQSSCFFCPFGVVDLSACISHRPQNQTQMSSISLFSSMDGLSPPPLKGQRSSWVGVAGSLLLVALLLWIFIPAAQDYYSGEYYQSLFTTNVNFTQPLYSRDDYKIALALRHKVTGALYDHQAVLENFRTYLFYDNLTSSYQEKLVLCEKGYFVGDINGQELDDCLMVPDYAQFDAYSAGNRFSSLTLVLLPPTAKTPFYVSTYVPSQKDVLFGDLLANYYVSFYFTSKVVTHSGQVRFQLHRAYSTQINIASDTLGASLLVGAGLRTTLMDDSIMPWRNNRNLTLMSYTGNVKGTDALNLQSAAVAGAQQMLRIGNTLEVAVRFYKKLDWLLGVIGGGMFILFAICWVVFSWYSRQVAQIQLAHQLLLQKITSDYPRSEEDLIPVRIPLWYMLKRMLPFCKEEKHEILLEQAERHNDISLLLKKLKVTKRNLARKEMLPERHDSKIIDLPQLDRINDEESSKDGSHMESQSHHQDNRAYGHLPDESLVNVQPRQSQQGRPPVVQLDSEDVEEEEGDEEEPAVQQYPREREEGLEESHNPFVQESVEGVQAPQVPLIDIPQAEAIQPPPVPQQQHNHHPHVHLAPVQPLHPLPAPVITNQQIHLPVPPQQLIIIGTTQQLAQYARNNPQHIQQLPRDPSLFSDPQGLPSTDAHSPKDDKFNLTTEQLTLLRTTDDPKVLSLLQNNPTFQAMREGKSASFPDLMELEQYDRWEGHYAPKLKKCMNRVCSQVGSFFSALDPFSVRVTLLDLSGSTTCCGVFLTLIILILSILTFALTIGNMSSTQFIISQNYIPTDQVSFSRTTDKDFNIILCAFRPSVFLGGGKLANFNFFTNIGGNVQTFLPVQMANNDPTLNLVGNAKFLPKAVNLSTCFRMPHGIPVHIDNQGSHFGFSFTPYCGSTPSFCASSIFATNANFLTAMTKNTLTLFLPGSRLDPSSNTLLTDVFITPNVNINLVPITQNMTLEETVFTNQVRLYDDTGNHLFRQAPLLKDANINAGYNTRRPYVKSGVSTSPSYTYRVRLNQASTDYTVTQRKMDWIVGIIGGVCVFWYAVVHLLGKVYMRFNFNAYVAKLVYDQEGYDESIVKRVLAMLPIPRCLLPKCMETRRESDRMRALDEKMEGSLTHLNILKYVDNCFRLSSAFFSSMQAKNFSLLYFKEKIFNDEQVFLGVKRVQAPPPQDELLDIDLADTLAMQKNQVTNSLLNLDSLHDRDIAAFTKEELDIARLRVQHQNQWDNVIDPPSSSCSQSTFTDQLDLFPEPHSFSFRGSKLFSSVTGGLCCMLMVILIILAVVFEVSVYVNNGGVTTSYDISMDDGVDSEGITLTTGKNFKIAVGFVDIATLQPVDPTPYIPYVGISIFQQEFTRQHGTVIPNIGITDFHPCPAGYIESWMSPSIDSSYFSGTGVAYCPPDNLVLSIVGQPDSQMFNSFKVSIYNKAGNANGQSNVTLLLNTTYVKLYFSSPRQNSISRKVDYQMQSRVFGGLTALTPFETNMTLSKWSVLYDDSHMYTASPVKAQSYRFQPYNQEWLGYNYYGPATGSLWFNISFSNTFKQHQYEITAPKLYEAFGITGGVIAFFYCIIACFVVPFNKYKLRYEIGRELYLFDKRRITETKERVKVKLRKNNSERRLTQKMNNLSEIRIMQAFILRPIAWIIGNYNFNETLRCVTLMQDRVARDLDMPQLYLSLYTLRDAISKGIKKEVGPSLPIRLLDVFFKKIANTRPQAFTIDKLRNYAKQHQLSSYEQMVVARAVQARIRVQEVFDSKFLENVFNVVDDGRSIRMDMMGDTQGSVNSNISSSLGHSVGEHSVDETGAEER